MVWSALTLAPALVAAQDGRDPRPEVDPYTEGEEKALKKAGYEGFGPFLWAGDVTTEVVEETLGGVPILWVETANFKIGSSLDGYDLSGDVAERKAVRKELERLRKRVPGVKTKTRTLDPWLRLHLYAMRLEELLADFMEAFDLDASEFPGKDMGSGPYLGLRDKFCVLLVEKSSSLARYTSAYCDRTIESSYRYYLPQTDSMFFGLAFENLTGSYATELGCWYATAFQVVENFSNGTAGYTQPLPLWWSIGIGRWFARRIDPRFLLFIGDQGTAIRGDDDADWEPKVRARVEHELYPTIEEMFTWTDWQELDFTQHMMLWSRVDFLMRQGPKKARNVLLGMSGPMTWTLDRPREEAFGEEFQRAFHGATGYSPADFDATWAEWVLKEYSKR